MPVVRSDDDPRAPLPRLVIDFYASHRHLIDHLAPLWHELDPAERGAFYIPKPKTARYAEARGIAPTVETPLWPGPLTVVANHADYSTIHHDRPIVYVEHGSGQTYVDHAWHPAYSGGLHRDRVACFLTLNETTAARERDTYPHARVEVVGSMRLDALASRLADPALAPPSGPSAWSAATTPSAPSPGVVALAWHWRCRIVPETYTAFDAWSGPLRGLARAGVRMVGHGHPKIYAELRRRYDEWGIPAIPSFARVLERADVLCFDNTSAGYEAAALGVPVVALNLPSWRRHVEHGLRFWDLVPGPQADHPGELMDAIAAAHSDEWAERRAVVSGEVYPPETRGNAARLAAQAVRVTLAETAHA